MGWRHDFGMQIAEDELSEFIRIYKEEFGEQLTNVQGGEITTRLIALCETLAAKLPDEQEQSITSILDDSDLVVDNRPRMGFRT
jgi:hypothetical protein